MLGTGYVEIEGVNFTPSEFEYELQPVEEVTESEAGTELVNVTRLDKHVFRATWEGIDAELLDQLERLCKSPTVTLRYRGEEYECRARGISPKLARKAYKYKRSDGIWTVSVTFTQI